MRTNGPAGGASRQARDERGSGPVAGEPAPGSGDPAPGSSEPLVGIGAAAQMAGVSQRALRYYQELGLITPQGCTPGGLRRYSQDDLARVARIRQLQSLLGLNLDEIALMLRSEDRMAEIRRAYYDEETGCAERRELVRESLKLQQDLRATVEAKRLGIEGFVTDLDARIVRTHALLDQMAGSVAPQAR
jgi:DNA-binding transcriptional MerR regulator